MQYLSWNDVLTDSQLHLSSVSRQQNQVCAVVPVYLAPWTACPPGGNPTAVGLPPGGQAVPGYLAPHPGYLHPRGQAVQAGLSCPPPNTSKNIYMLFCYFSVSF